MSIKFELNEDVQVLVIDDRSTVKPVVTLTKDEESIFLEETACGGELLIISVTNKGEIVRRYAIKTAEMLKHAKVLTLGQGKTWQKASIKDMQKLGMYLGLV